MTEPSRPLPASLTRLLTVQPGSAFAPTPGDRVRHGRPAPAPSPDPHGALEDRVLRGVVVALGALVWLAIAWLVLRHFLPSGPV